MIRFRLKAALAVVVGVAITGFFVTPQNAWAENVDLGTGSQGSACHAERDGAYQADRPQTVRLYCGTGTTAIGTLYATPLPKPLPSEQAGYRAALTAAAKGTTFTQEQAVHLTCESETWQPAPAGAVGDALVGSCKSSEGGFPMTLVTLARGNVLIQGTVTPAALDVLMRAVPLLIGQAPLPAAKQEATSGAASATAAGGLVREEDAAAFNELTHALSQADARDDHVQAEAISRKILALEERVLGSDHPGLADILMTMAVEVSAQHRYGEADKLFERATTLLGRTITPEAKARLLAYQALHNLNRGSYKEALQLANDAIAARRKGVSEAENASDGGAGLYGLGGNGLPRARSELTHALMIGALANTHSGRLPEAEGDIAEAITLLESQRGLPDFWRTEALDILGRVHTERGDTGKAEYELTEVVKQNMKLFGPSTPTAFALLDLATDFDAEHRYLDAAKTYAAVLEMASKAGIGAAFTTDSLMPMVHTADALDTLDPAQRVLVTDLAFQTIQWADQGVAGQTLTRTIARLAADQPEAAKAVQALQDAERARDTYRTDWAAEVGKPAAEQSPDRQAWLADHYKAAAEVATRAEAEVRRVFPAYDELTHPKVNTIAATRALLGKDEALVVYDFADEQGAVFVVTANDAWVVPLAIGDKKIAEAVTTLRSSVDVEQGHVKPFDLQVSNDLYKAIFAPIAGHLHGISRLAVVTGGGPLSGLPLSVLVGSKSVAVGDYVHADWLVNHFSLVYQPSVQTFVAERKAPVHAAASRPLLALGNPSFTGNKTAGDKATESIASYCRQDGPMPAAVLAALAPLPDTETEVHRVATALGAQPSDVLTGAQATEINLRTKPLDQYRVLYFATHGLLPAELHCLAEPGLALSPNPSAKTRAEDGLLEASEIADLHLNADLVVLSACNTANGGGEALSGLVASFFRAGARAMLVSHWAVPSAATASLMSSVFSGGDKKSLDLAVQSGELSLIHKPETAHPVNWAAFVVVGNASGATP